MDEHARLDERQVAQLRWRCRRGLLENDLLIERFFERYGQTLTVHQARGLQALMNLSDNDLLDLLLRRREPDAALATPEVVDVLAMMRTPLRSDAAAVPPSPHLSREST